MSAQGELSLRNRGKEVLLRLRVRPSAGRDRIIGVHAGSLKCQVTAAPERGKANRAVLRLLAEALRLRKGSLEIVAGSTSPDKTVAIAHLNAEDLRLRVARALDPEQRSRGRG